MLEIKRHWRNRVDARRLAESLAGALRSGVLEFGERIRGALPVRQAWIDDDEPEPERMTRAIVPSRYHVLGYRQEGPYDLSVPAEPALRMLAAPDPFRMVRDEELLLGIPREFIRPENERGRIDRPAHDEPRQWLALDASQESDTASD
jgi:hypothetical protein